MESAQLHDCGFVRAFDQLAFKIYSTAVDKGWWDEPREDGTLIALIHSELSECLEGLRHGNPKSEHILEFSSAEEELADVVIRVMDLAKGRGWKLAEAIIAKYEFNKGRAYKHGGKKF